MGNIIEAFNRGQDDSQKGIPMGEGLESLSMHINGVQPAKIYGIAGPQKSGKSTLADYAFIIAPYLSSLITGKKIEWIYYSFEISRINKEFDFAVFFINHDFNISTIKLPPGITRKGKDEIELNSTYLQGQMLDDNFNTIKIDPEVYEALKQVYTNRIIPLFGEYDVKGFLITPGLITFIEKKENPTGIYKDLRKRAESKGKLNTNAKGDWISYIPDDPEVLTIVLIDHIRKLKTERNWNIKQTIDKMSEYLVDIRNFFGYALVPILHTNRNLTSGDRAKFSGENIYPTGDDLKDSGNLGEDCDYLLTIFNPNDDKYNLTEHFGLVLKSQRGSRLYPNLRTIHLVESRHCEFPAHFKTKIVGNLKKFEKLEIE